MSVIACLQRLLSALPVTQEQSPSCRERPTGNNNLAHDALSKSEWSGNTVSYHGKPKYPQVCLFDIVREGPNREERQ